MYLEKPFHFTFLYLLKDYFLLCLWTKDSFVVFIIKLILSSENIDYEIDQNFYFLINQYFKEAFFNIALKYQDL